MRVVKEKDKTLTVEEVKQWYQEKYGYDDGDDDSDERKVKVVTKEADANGFVEKEVIGAPPKDGDIPITISHHAYHKIMWWVHRCPVEIGGYGTVLHDPETGYYIKDAFLVGQEVTGADVEFSPEQEAEALEEYHKEEGELLFWWHSHVNMAVVWSSTDYENIYRKGRDGLIISTVFNKKEEMRTSIYIGTQGMRHEFFKDDIPLVVEDPVYEDEEVLEKEYKDKVVVASVRPTTYSSRYTNHNYETMKGWDTTEDYLPFKDGDYDYDVNGKPIAGHDATHESFHETGGFHFTGYMWRNTHIMVDDMGEEYHRVITSKGNGWKPEETNRNLAMVIFSHQCKYDLDASEGVYYFSSGSIGGAREKHEEEDIKL